MNQTTKTWVLRILRWSIAVAGIWYILAQISLFDRVMILDADGRPRMVRTQDEDAYSVTIRTENGLQRIDKNDLWTPPNPARAVVDGRKVTVLAVKADPEERDVPPNALWIEENGLRRKITPDAAPEYRVLVPYPPVEMGLIHRVKGAEPMWLWLSVLIFPMTFLITSVRWHALLKPLGIHMPLLRTLTLNMVGAFYNTFMPGSTGGDVLKAWYAAKQTPLRTYAVMSVIVDRVIGLLALIVLGGAMAAYQYLTAENTGDPVARSCLKIAVACAGILAGVALSMEFVFSPLLRRIFFIDFLIARLPMQRQVQKAIEVMRIYRRSPALVIGSLLGTLPVHATVVFSAMFAGFAFGLKLQPLYYFAAVPVIVLVGSIPVSPQGAGVMEFFAIRLTERHGVTVAEAFILTMSIRLVQILWNLAGGVFVLRGGYHAPSQSQQNDLQEDQPTEPGAEVPRAGI